MTPQGSPAGLRKLRRRLVRFMRPELPKQPVRQKQPRPQRRLRLCRQVKSILVDEAVHQKDLNSILLALEDRNNTLTMVIQFTRSQVNQTNKTLKTIGELIV